MQWCSVATGPPPTTAAASRLAEAAGQVDPAAQIACIAAAPSSATVVASATGRRAAIALAQTSRTLANEAERVSGGEPSR